MESHHLLNKNPAFEMETADEKRTHEDTGVIDVEESMAMPADSFMIPEGYRVLPEKLLHRIEVYQECSPYKGNDQGPYSEAGQ